MTKDVIENNRRIRKENRRLLEENSSLKIENESLKKQLTEAQQAVLTYKNELFKLQTEISNKEIAKK